MLCAGQSSYAIPISFLHWPFFVHVCIDVLKQERALPKLIQKVWNIFVSFPYSRAWGQNWNVKILKRWHPVMTPHPILKLLNMIHFTLIVCLWLCTSLLGVTGMTESQVCPDIWPCTVNILAYYRVLAENKFSFGVSVGWTLHLKRNHSDVCTTACNISSSSCQINKTKPQSQHRVCVQFTSAVWEPQHNSNQKLLPWSFT